MISNDCEKVLESDNIQRIARPITSDPAYLISFPITDSVNLQRNDYDTDPIRCY